MTDQAKITSETALMMEKMVGLDKDDPRYKVLKAAIDYKASWVELAESLNVIAENKEYKEWGYTKFKDYCTEELQLRQSTARKLVRGFQWIDQQAPQLLPQHINDEIELAEREGREAPVVPDVETVNVLVKAQREVDRDRLTKEAYDELKDRALRGEQTSTELKKDLKEKVVVPEPDPLEEQIKTMRRSLRATERIVTQIEELGIEEPEITELAEKLRDKLFDHVSGLLDQKAYKDGGEAADAADAKADQGATGTNEEKPRGKTESMTVLVGTKESATGSSE